MVKQRKYPISIGMTFELLQMLDERVESEGLKSRSQLVEQILRENIHAECNRCKKVTKLANEGMIDLPLEIDGSEEDLDHYISEVKARRKAMYMILDIVESLSNNANGYAMLSDILDEAENQGMSRELAELEIERFNMNGRLMRPTGYDTVQLV